MKNGTRPTQRAKFINGLRDLASYLGAHPGFPVPDYTATIHVFPDGDTDAERRAGVDRLAAILGATTEERNGHYWAERAFGPVIYTVVCIDDAARANRDTHPQRRPQVSTMPPDHPRMNVPARPHQRRAGADPLPAPPAREETSCTTT